MPKKKSEVKSKKPAKAKKETPGPIQQAIRSLIKEDIEVYELEEVYSTLEGIIEVTIPRVAVPPKKSLVEGILNDLSQSIDDLLQFDVELDCLDVELVDGGFQDDDVKKIVKSHVKRWVKEDPDEVDALEYPDEILNLLEKVRNSPSSIFTKDDYIILLQELAKISEGIEKNPKIDESSLIEEITDAITSAPISITNFDLDVDGSSLVISNIEIDMEDLAQEIEGVLDDAPERGYFG